MTVEGLSRGRARFALKAWDDAENVAALSNVAEAEVR